MAGALLHSPSLFLPSSHTSSFSVSRIRVKSTGGRSRIGGIGIGSLNVVINSVASVVDQSTAKQGVDGLWTWLTETGAVSGGDSAAVAVKPSVVKEGFGLTAQRAVRKGEELLQVPRGSWICLETVKQSAVGRFLGGQRPWVKLAVFLIAERADSSSKWRPYIASLPQSLNSTLFWSVYFPCS